MCLQKGTGATNVYARESQHFNQRALAHGEGTCMHEKGSIALKA